MDPLSAQHIAYLESVVDQLRETVRDGEEERNALVRSLHQLGEAQSVAAANSAAAVSNNTIESKKAPQSKRLSSTPLVLKGLVQSKEEGERNSIKEKEGWKFFYKPTQGGHGGADHQYIKTLEAENRKLSMQIERLEKELARKDSDMDHAQRLYHKKLAAVESAAQNSSDQATALRAELLAVQKEYNELSDAVRQQLARSGV